MHPFGFSLRIFDTQTRTFLDTNFGYMNRDRNADYLWSPDSTRVAFWVSGPVGTEYPIDTNVRQLVIYDTVEARYLFTPGFYMDRQEINPGGVLNWSPELVWSPDSSNLVFINESGELIYVLVEARRPAPGYPRHR